MKDYYRRNHGAVVSTTIQKFMYVNVNRHFEGNVRASYSQTENVEQSKDLKHGIIREALQFFNINKGIEVITIADVPGRGTGLGSSSALAVGLSKALTRYVSPDMNPDYSPEHYARVGCHIEIERCHSPIGKQDQYACAYGGLNYIRFNLDESVKVEPLRLSRNTKAELEDCLMCFHTGVARSSSPILKVQRRNIPRRTEVLDQMRDQADGWRDKLKNNDISGFGKSLRSAWELKKKLADKITNPHIESLYGEAVKAGAEGGKISGAGGGGFLTLYVPRQKQNKVRESLSFLKEIEVKIDGRGTEIVYVD